MKFIHLSDTHLGFSDYHKIDPSTGINQREQDFYNAWFHVIDRVLELSPDFVVHAGDLFHTTRPTNRAIAVAMEGIQRVSERGIPFILISGNHSTPKIRATGSIFEAISLFPQVHAAFSGMYECFKIGDCEIHCIPHCSLSETLKTEFEKIKADPALKYHVLVTHGSWAGQKTYSMGEFNEQLLPDLDKMLDIRFDYIALGHYHRHLEISPTIVYSGSTEKTSFNETGNINGFVLVDLAATTTTFIATPARPMVKLGPIDCRSLNANLIYAAMEKMSTPDLDQALVSLTLSNVSHETLIKLDSRHIEGLFPQVFYLTTQMTQVDASGERPGFSATLGTLPVEFERYIDSIETGELDKERLKKLGLGYLTEED
ncbi:MAG: metallophosphoesterase family protein [Candidatus Zhuqueibacterota bacterium]